MKTFRTFISILLIATAFLTTSCNKDDNPADQKVTYSIQASLSTTKTGVSADDISSAISYYCGKLVSAVSNAASDSDAISKVEAVIEDFKTNWSPCSGTVIVSRNIGEQSTEIKTITF